MKSEKNRETIKLIIVDDHNLFRMGARLALDGKSEIGVTGEAASGEELFVLLKTQIPDIILLDILLPGISGIETARKLKQGYPEIKILMLSAENPAHVIEEVLEAGVEGYVTKSATPEEIEEAIVSVANGLEFFGRDMAKIMFDVIHRQRKRVKQEVAFTDRETEIIRLCSEGLQSKEIADRLKISYHTVNFHKNNIFRKLDINNSVELAKYAIKEGII